MPRKISAPKLNTEWIERRYLDPLGEYEELLNNFKLRMQVMEREFIEKEISIEAFCLEALLCFGSLYDVGFDNETILKFFPFEEWKKETIELPAPIVMRLTEAFAEYKAADSGVSLGEAFHMEGSRNPHARSRIRSVLKYWDLGTGVVARYVVSATSEKPITIDEAISQISEKTGESEATVRRAYRRFGQEELEMRQAAGHFDAPEKK